MTTDTDNNNLTNQFVTLLQHSTSLLHNINSNKNVVDDWLSTILTNDTATTNSDDESKDNVASGDNKRATTQSQQDEVDDEDSDDDSSDDDDDMMLMLGGYSSSEDEADDDYSSRPPTNNTNNNDEDIAIMMEDTTEYINEEEISLLKRAMGVHSALLLSLPQSTATEEEGSSSSGGTTIVKELIAAILDPTSTSSDSNNNNNNKLVSILSHIIFSSSTIIGSNSKHHHHPIKSISKLRWQKICLTNSLLAVQFLLHILKSSSGSAASNDSSTLEEWNTVILPLLFGKLNSSTSSSSSSSNKAPNASLFLLNDALRETILSTLVSTTSFLPSSSNEQDSSSDDKQQCSIQSAVNICTSTLEHVTSTKEIKKLRQKYILVVCQVLLCVYDGIIIMQGQRGDDDDDDKELEVVKNGMQNVMLLILRGICYESSSGEEAAPLLSIEALRPVTSLLLPKLYPNDGNGNGKEEAAIKNERVIELWKEVLLLLNPYSDEWVIELNNDDGKKQRRCCKNWDQVSPMVATSMLCILLPTFRKMDLPTTTDDSTNEPSRRRPIYQPNLWHLIRTCLSKCSDFVNLDSGGRGTSLLSNSHGNYDDNDGNMDVDRASMDQLLRRRSAHMLQLMIEYERELCKKGGSGKKGKKNKKDNQTITTLSSASNEDNEIDIWMKYALCFEMLEMETVIHLVEQVWETVKEIVSHVAVVANNEPKEGEGDGGDGDETNQQLRQQLPSLVWEDVSSLLCRILLSDAPTMRKIGLYRFMSGHAGVDVTNPNSSMDDNNSGANVVKEEEETNVFMRQPKSKGQIKKATSGVVSIQSAPLSIVSVEFVLNVLIPSYDSLVGTKVGLNMQIEEAGKFGSESIANLLAEFISSYTVTLAKASGGKGGLSEFVNRVFGADLIKNYKTRSLVAPVYRPVATALDSSGSGLFDIDPINIQAMIRAMRATFSSGGAPKSMQEELKLCLAIVLKNTNPWKKVDATVVLQVLAIYPPSNELDDTEQTTARSKARHALGKWVLRLGDGIWAQSAASACASAYVLGQLHSYGENDIMAGVNSIEREIGMAICTLCSLSGNGSELLWPAVFKGLQTVPVTTTSSTPGFCKANRSMILLEFGCKETVLSGMGNGDLVVNSKELMMPPPSNIDSLLGNAVQFILSQLVSVETTLFKVNEGGGSSGGSTRSSTSNSASSYIAVLIGQLRVLHLAYPSSVTLPRAVDKMLADCINFLTKDQTDDDKASIVKYLMLTYAALSCGATFNESGDKLSNLISTCHTVLGLKLTIPAGIKKDAKQACRSIFQYAKWGALSLIIPMIMEEAEIQSIEIVELYQAILDSALQSVDATPVIALPPLFEAALGAGKHIVTFEGEKSILSSLQTIIDTLFAVLKETSNSSSWTYMLNQICQLIFNPKLLFDEYQLSYASSSSGPMPVKKAFETLMKIGSNNKPYVIKTAVSQISVAWLGPEEETNSNTGVCAIPYRQSIVDLLIYKEMKYDETSAHLGAGENYNLPKNTDSSSMTRAFVMSFLSKLPLPDVMSDVVLHELVHYIITKLLKICCTEPSSREVNITGSETYQKMTRSWQALCLLSRFVTEDIASEVATKVFSAMGFTMHGEIRYFIEVFT